MKNNNSGQTLLEALIALSLLTIVMGATAIAVLSSLNNASAIKQQDLANKLAQQGMEYIRDQIANNGQYATYTALADGNPKCLTGNYTLKAACTCDATSCDYVNTMYKRQVTFSSGTCGFANGLSVTVNVSWTGGKCTQSFCNKQQVISCFANTSTGTAP